MTREIKFRVWNCTRKVMCEVDLYTSLNSIKPGVWNFGWEGDGRESGNMEEVDGKKLILMQYTGLKDKNGKEVYEGDIVKGNNNPNLLEVAYQTAGFHLYFHDRSLCHWEADVFYKSSYKLEVVGNIYENSELLQ